MTAVLVLHLAGFAGSFTVHVTAPKETGQAVLLYRYDDLITLRTVRVAEAPLGEDGKATLSGSVEGTVRMQLRIADAVADLYVRSGSVLNVEWPGPDPRVPRSLNRPVRVPIVFHDMDALDVNALTSDLNERLDDFLMEDLATDDAAGMQVFDIQRKSGELPDTTSRPPTLFVTPALSTARVDTFEQKLKRFYRGIDDPWFDGYLEYGIAGLRHGPRANDRELYERYLKERPMLYTDPEYMRFVLGMFEDHLLSFAVRHHQRDLERAMALGELDSLTAIFARHDFLKDDGRLRELVTLEQLYTHYNSQHVRRKAVEDMLEQASVRSAYAEHRHLAANMLWDLTAMSKGSTLPALRLLDLNGNAADMAVLNEGPVCLVITATWCTYCELEMVGLENLQKEYAGVIPIVVIALDKDPAAIKSYLKLHPGRDFTWLHAEAELQLREDLRLRNLPTVLLLQDGVLVRSPAPLPSGGLGEVFHRTRSQAERDGRIKVWDD
ncbi:MAG: thioredoxin-like domain-containing protein [Flavobacteriales bacterium]